MNTSTNISQWIRCNQMVTCRNIWFCGEVSFLGGNTTNFTSSNQLFLSNGNTTLWRFEVVYIFPTGQSSSALNFVINQLPFNGTTNTLINISCINYFDDDGLKLIHFIVNRLYWLIDEFRLGWKNDRSKSVMISFNFFRYFKLIYPLEMIKHYYFI